MSGKMADDLQDGGEGGGASGQNGARMLISKIREMETSVTEMARQFPSAAQASRQVQEGLRAMLRQIVANPGGQEPPSPEGQDA
jgi:molybdenum-dependent DNA-binding transcriptional regulator ModE